MSAGAVRGSRKTRQRRLFGLSMAVGVVGATAIVAAILLRPETFELRQGGVVEHSKSGSMESNTGSVPVAPGMAEGTALAVPVDTGLWVLKGIVQGPHGGRAIIMQPELGLGEYGVGDQLGGGARVDMILPDRVILQTGEHYVTLRLSADALSFNSGQDSTVSQTMLMVLRDDVLDGPERVLALLDARVAVKGGRQIGYRVYPPEVPEFMDLLGLEPGDLVTSLDGIPLSSEGSLQTALMQLSHKDRFEITVYRNGIPETFVMGVPQ